MDTGFLISAFVTLFVVIDPIGLAPIFVALTAGMTQAQRRAIIFRALVISTGLLTVFAFTGEQVLDFMGISMPAFRIAGGLLLFVTAFDMLFERRTKRREDQSEEADAPDPSVFPMAMPLIAGPGSIATIILLVGQQPDVAGKAAILGVMAAVLAILAMTLLASGLIERALGRTGVMVLTRLFGMLLAALSVQFVLDGLSDVWAGMG
ncbi:MAG: MarC family protein [Rhodobacteraceae bacterium]|nr:MarC family protein [Paracoccaceae bacterium]